MISFRTQVPTFDYVYQCVSNTQNIYIYELCYLSSDSHFITVRLGTFQSTNKCALSFYLNFQPRLSGFFQLSTSSLVLKKLKYSYSTTIVRAFNDKGRSECVQKLLQSQFSKRKKIAPENHTSIMFCPISQLSSFQFLLSLTNSSATATWPSIVNIDGRVYLFENLEATVTKSLDSTLRKSLL